jgi:uncharacterized protein (DUF2345 family)
VKHAVRLLGLFTLGIAVVPVVGAQLDGSALIAAQVAKLTASDAATNDEFGVSVSVSGDTMVAGALFKDSFAGAAYVFERGMGGADTWSETKKLVARDRAVNDRFGVSVCISGDTVVVGASGENSVTGAAYVFERNAGGTNNWGQVKKLRAGDRATGDLFGAAVSINRDTVVVGANGKVSGRGAAYVFERDAGGAGNWGQVKKLTASDAADGDDFGVSVSISGDTLVVGAEAKGSGTGAAYVFERNAGGAGNWGQLKKLSPKDATSTDAFGFSVGIGGNTLVATAPAKDSLTGAAYIFERNEGGTNNWGQTKKLTASDAAILDDFGQSVSISGDIVAVGAALKDSGTGAGYVFARDQGGRNNWGEVSKLTANDAAVQDMFGISIAVDGNTVVAGADGKAFRKGAAYVFAVRALEITAIEPVGNHVRIHWRTVAGQTNIVEASNGDAAGAFTSDFTGISGPIIVPGTGLVITNYTDVGAASGATTSRYYRVRLLP